jgi:hypothetical protein
MILRPLSFHRLADAAAVNAMASGSHVSTISAMSQRIAFSLSVLAPINSATYRIGALSVSILRPVETRAARSALRSARATPSSRQWSCPELGYQEACGVSAHRWRF